MKISRWDSVNPAYIDQFLVRERERRVLAPERQIIDDFAILYEPNEAFSIVRDKDLASIRKETEQEFKTYVTWRNIPIIKMHRGGGMMWHGPGQVILAPLVDIRRLHFDTSTYSSVLERTCLLTLRKFNIEGRLHHYRPGAQGIWVEDKEHGSELRKIAFFGWNESRGIAIHGCAINIFPDLRPFSFIDPCNLPGVKVTSMEKVLGRTPSVSDVARVLAETFEKTVFEEKEKLFT